MSTPRCSTRARARLADAPREALGELREPRRVLGIADRRASSRAATPGISACCSSAMTLFATGDIIRARQEAPRGYAAESQRQRAALAAAARRGGLRGGRDRAHRVAELDPDAVDEGAASGPARADATACRACDGAPQAAYMSLETYLGERVELLLNPPAGGVTGSTGGSEAAREGAEQSHGFGDGCREHAARDGSKSFAAK